MSEISIVDVYGQCGGFPFSERSWQLLLGLASRYGWQPAGTLAPDPDYFDDYLGNPINWPGHYIPAEGQVMTADDAHRLADALERALPDLPDHDVLSGKVMPDGSACDDDLALWSRPARPHVTPSPVEEFSGSNKALLRDFVIHCRECAEFWLC
jgi:hypothetical protein